MFNFDEIFERIKQATNTRTQVELAEVLGIRQSSISDAKRRNSVPADWYMKLFEQFGLNPDWLKKGDGPMYLSGEQGYVPMDAPIGMVCEDPSRYGGPDAKSSLATIYGTNLPTNADTALGPVLGKLNIPQSFATPSLQVVRVDVGSMAPVVLKGAYVGIDTANRYVVSGELYGVRLPYEGLVIKRAYIDMQGSALQLHSENPAHPIVTLPLDGHEPHIVGRVVWVMQKI